ncbi:MULTISPECIES: hypothetical protein [unclassified Streptomyces]|nr:MULTISPECIES: hypothetical protein [unclassified Streptomyces]
MTGVAAYIILVAVLTMTLCNHHGEEGRAVGRTVLRVLRRSIR